MAAWRLRQIGDSAAGGLSLSCRAMMSRNATFLFAAAALLGSASAQIQKGAPAPAFPFQKVWNNGPESFDDFAGRVVVLKFSETW